MTASDSDDSNIRAASEGLVSAHIVVSTVFLALGGILFTLALAAATFPGSFGGIVSYGRLRPAALTATMIGWLVISFTGAVYYVLPRLTGTRLWNPALARMGMAVTAIVAVIGSVLALFGLGDGHEPFGMPVWLDVVLLAAVVVPLVVVIQTVRARSEGGVYVTLWFVMAAVTALPLLQLVATIPPSSSVGQALQATTFTAGFVTLWVFMLGSGVAFYTVVRSTGNPLSNRQLARVGFWSLVFAAAWAGPLQLVSGPTPDWLDGVAAVLTLALPVGMFANAVGVATTAGSAGYGDASPVVRATTGGLWIGTAVALATSIGGFKSAATLVGLTSYWDGVLVGALFGAGGLLVAGWSYQAIPAVTGRTSDNTRTALGAIRLMGWGSAATMVLLLAGGIVSGFSWTGGAYRETYATGEGWTTLAGPGGVLIGLATIGMIATLVGLLMFATSVFGIVTSGRATEQEVLVERKVRA